MRSLMLLTMMILCVPPAMAQKEGSQELLIKMRDVELELKQLQLRSIRELRTTSIESLAEQLNDLDQQAFELELELARTNAHRSVLLKRLDREKDLINVEKDVVLRRLEIEDRRRAAAEEELERATLLVGEGSMTSKELNQIQIRLMEIEERAAEMRMMPLRKEIKLEEILMEVEMESATHEALQRQMQKRRKEAEAKFERAINIEEARAALESKHQKVMDLFERAHREEGAVRADRDSSRRE